MPSYLKGGNSFHLPVNCCAFCYREHVPGHLAQWQARTLPQDWRDMVFGAVSNLRRLLVTADYLLLLPGAGAQGLGICWCYPALPFPQLTNCQQKVLFG